jgi:hypothetical protein
MNSLVIFGRTSEAWLQLSAGAHHQNSAFQIDYEKELDSTLIESLCALWNRAMNIIL